MDIKKGALDNVVFGNQGKGNVSFGAKQTDGQTKPSLNLVFLLFLGLWANHFTSLSLSLFTYKMGVILHILQSFRENG